MSLTAGRKYTFNSELNFATINEKIRIPRHMRNASPGKFYILCYKACVWQGIGKHTLKSEKKLYFGRKQQGSVKPSHF